MPIKLPWMKKDGSEELELTLSDDAKKQLLDGTASKADVDEVKTLLQKQQEALAAISANAQAEAEERRKAAARKAAEDANASRTQTEEELQELFLTNPVEATRRIIEGAQGNRDKALLTINASNLKREVFDDSSKYPFYTDKIKDEVDKLIAQQNLTAQNDRSVLEHAYHSVVGQHYQELSEGKLKSRFASSEGNRGVGGEGGGAGKKGPRTLSEDERRAASLLGFKDEDYAKMLEEEGIGAV